MPTTSKTPQHTCDRSTTTTDRQAVNVVADISLRYLTSEPLIVDTHRNATCFEDNRACEGVSQTTPTNGDDVHQGTDIDRSAVSKSLAKAITYKQCGRDDEAQKWARLLVEQLECAEILNGSHDVGSDGPFSDPNYRRAS